MKSSNVHAILSELHRLLSLYDASDFTKASEYVGESSRVRNALRALARESGNESMDVPSSVESPRSGRAGSGTPPANRTDLTAQIVDTIRQQSGRFGSTASILQFAKNVGLSIQGRHKESRERLARRVAEAILQLREPRRNQILAMLADSADSQTQGWIDVIKSRRP